jgi:hypothetical protein
MDTLGHTAHDRIGVMYCDGGSLGAAGACFVCGLADDSSYGKRRMRIGNTRIPKKGNKAHPGICAGVKIERILFECTKFSI